MEELRREREAAGPKHDRRAGRGSLARAETDAERRRRERIEGWPPPWAPTIFVKKPRP